MDARPHICCGDLSNPPAALQPLLVRPQWSIWRLTWTGNRWTKPPFQARDPQQHANSADPTTWTDYDTAVTAAAGHGDGVSYILTPADELAAVDIDRVRDPATGTIADWAQQILDQARHAYVEISPSGAGLRIWGAAVGQSLQRKFNLEHGALELFRRTRKPLTVTALQLGQCRELGNIDRLIDRTVRWAEHHKTTTTAGASSAGSKAGPLEIDEIERLVRESPAPINGQSIRSEMFHVVVGHYHGCGWSAEQIFAHLEQFPDGVGGKYLAEGRLSGEIARSLRRLKEYSLTLRQETVTNARARTLKKLAGHLMRRYVDPILTLHLLHSWNQTRCQPPLEAAEVDRIADAVAVEERQRREKRS